MTLVRQQQETPNMRIWLSYTTACFAVEWTARGEGPYEVPEDGDFLFFGCTEENLGSDKTIWVSSETQKAVAALYHAAKAKGRALCAGDIQRESGEDGIYAALRALTGNAQAFDAARAAVDPRNERCYCYPVGQEILARMGIEVISHVTVRKET
jgi:hypothetical protein